MNTEGRALVILSAGMVGSFPVNDLLGGYNCVFSAMCRRAREIARVSLGCIKLALPPYCFKASTKSTNTFRELGGSGIKDSLTAGTPYTRSCPARKAAVLGPVLMAAPVMSLVVVMRCLVGSSVGKILLGDLPPASSQPCLHVL